VRCVHRDNEEYNESEVCGRDGRSLSACDAVVAGEGLEASGFSSVAGARGLVALTVLRPSPILPLIIVIG